MIRRFFRLRRRIQILLGVFVGSVAALILCQIVLLPFFIRRELTSLLRGAGFKDATFELRRASIWGIDVHRISSTQSSQQFAIESLDVRYAPWRALSGQLDAVAIRNAKLVMPLQFGTAETKTVAGPIPIKDIALKDCSVELSGLSRPISFPIDATLHQRADQSFDLNLAAQLGNVPINASGTILPQNDQADLKASSHGVGIANLFPLLPESVREVIEDASGDLYFDASYHRAGPDAATARGTVQLHDATIRGTKDYPLVLRNLAASVNFELGGGGKLDISQADARWDGGHVFVEGFAFDPNSHRADFLFVVDRIDLEAVLSIASTQRATAHGTLSGRVPAHLAFGKNGFQIRLDSGIFQADAPGTLVLGDEWAAQLAAAIGPGANAQGVNVQQRAADALSNFEFDDFKIELIRTEDRLRVVVTIRGKGRTGAKQPLDLTFNAAGVEHALNFYLSGSSGVSTSKQAD